ncbi:MAG: hypothetical protein U0163_05050 [Gemmatimonadaceae bacterium]
MAQFVQRLFDDGVLSKELNFHAYAVGIGDQAVPVTPLLVVLGAVSLVLVTVAPTWPPGWCEASGGARACWSAGVSAEGRRLTRLLFAESALLAATGSWPLGVAIAWGAVAPVKAVAPPTLPRIAEAHIDPGCWRLSSAWTTVVALRLRPALQATRIFPRGRIAGEGGKGATSARLFRGDRRW